MSFLVTLGIIFFVALLSSYLRGSARDRCLRDFHGYQITVEKKNGHIIWGTMHLEPTGMEIEYQTDVQDLAHIETSYLLYKSEYKDLQGIYRYTDELSPQSLRRRQRDLRRSFHPGLLRVVSRKIRNFISTATDSFSEAVAFVTGQAKKPAGRFISDTGQTSLTRLGKDLIGYVGTTFDPLLEEYVGAKVVVEVAEGDEIREYAGVLKEYSADFLEILDVFYPQALSVNLASAESREALARNVRITSDDKIRIENLSGLPLLLHRIKCGDRQGEIEAVIGPGDEISLQELALTETRTADHAELAVFFEGMKKGEEDALEATQMGDSRQREGSHELLQRFCEASEAKDIEFDFKVIRVIDMIVPRAHALVRHKAERYDPDDVFGEIGIAWRSLREGKEDEEITLRANLRKNPHDVASCLGLTRLLVQQGKLEEAVPLLERALEHRERLVDHGRLVELQLQMVRRKLARVQAMAR